MSRGISCQQRILGLAVAISRCRYGEPVSRVPTPRPRYRIPVVQDDVLPDIWCAIAAHILGGVALRAHKHDLRRVFLETTQPARTARSIIARALASLLERELLAYCPWERTRAGYCLTASGLAAGLPHEPDIPDLGRRVWLMNQWKRPKDGHHPEWHLPWPRILPSPVIADALDALTAPATPP